MHRLFLISLIENFYSTSALEQREKECMLNFVEENENCFSRDCKHGNITCCCWLENFDGTKFLLTKHKKASLWTQLGGHAENETDPIKVAIRETREESGLTNIKLISNKIFDIGLHMSPKIMTREPHIHYDVRFLARASNKEEEIKISNESLDLQWFYTPPDGAVSDVARMFKKWKADNLKCTNKQ